MVWVSWAVVLLRLCVWCALVGDFYILTYGHRRDWTPKDALSATSSLFADQSRLNLHLKEISRLVDAQKIHTR